MNINDVQLYSLSDALREMVSILHLDKNNPWITVFSVLQKKAESMLCSECTRDDLNQLSSAIINIYRAESGFSDYVPLEFNRQRRGFYLISGAENFTDISWRIYSIAEEMLSGDSNL